MPRTRRSLARRAVYFVFMLVACVLLLEGGSYFLYWIDQGEPFTYERAATQRARVGVGLEAAVPDGRLGTEMDYVTIHPFLGYVYDTSATVTDEYVRAYQERINPFGMTGPAPIQKRAADRLIVGVAGGSVAHALVLDAQQHLRRLLAGLPQYRNREVVVVAIAMGGWKAPQPLQAVSWFLSQGGEFDVVVNLDGYNEVIGGDKLLRDGVFPMFPVDWHLMANTSADRGHLGRIGAVVAGVDRRKELAARFGQGLFADSVTLQLLWTVLDRQAATELVAARIALHVYQRPDRTFRDSGPGAAGWQGPRRFERIAEAWRRCSLAFDRLCRGNGIRYYHFLQPNQYLGHKPMSAAERKVAWDDANPLRPVLAAGYPALQKEGPELVRAGVCYRDLTGVFSDVHEPVYQDTCCHLNPRGSELIARAIVTTIAEHQELENAQLEDLRVEPVDVTIEDPMVPVRLRVTGRLRGGAERPLAAAHCGARYESSAAAVVSVTPDGELRALREGTATVTVQNQGFSARVAVRSEWRAVTSFGIGILGHGDRAPVLEPAGGEPRVGSRDFRVRVRDVRPGASGVVVVTGRIPPEYPSTLLDALRAEEVVLLHVQASGGADRPAGGTVELAVPIPNDPSVRGRTSYLQAVFEDDEAIGGRSTSNGLRVLVR